MQLINSELFLSPSDLVKFLECEHLTRLDLDACNGVLTAAPTRADTAELLARKGDEHETALLDRLRAGTGSVAEIDTSVPLAESYQATIDAMRRGAGIIYQAALRNGAWRGYADFLERVDHPSDLGAFSYEPADAKLARQVKPAHVLQLCLYAELLEFVQGSAPERAHVVLGSGERVTLRLAEFSAYFRRIRAEFVGRLDSGLEYTYPLPVAHCGLCRWSDLCDQRWLTDDHLSLVANMRRDQLVRLEQHGITTVAGLGAATKDVRPPRMSERAYERLRQQARLQTQQGETGRLCYELIPPSVTDAEKSPPRGFELLPAASEGDVFFDIEGDPFYEDGLEYLWGVVYREQGERRFVPFWGRDRAEEKRAFESFVDWVMERRMRYPDMHIYHYAHYERTAMERLMGLHATREAEVDQLLRGSVLVDLYRVVEQSMRISQPSYSLKKIEAFYMEPRETSVTDGEDSIIWFEEWLESGDEDLLARIADYNRDDCISTLLLRDWLLDRRDEAQDAFGVDIPYRSPGELAAPDQQAERDQDVAALQARLWASIPADPAELEWGDRPWWLMGHLLTYHRREEKPVWWELFGRCDASDHELTERDTEAIGGLQPEGTLVPIGGRSRSFTQRLTFPSQEHKLGPGTWIDPFSVDRDAVTGSPLPWTADAWDVRELKDDEGILVVKVGPSREHAPPPRALVPGMPYDTSGQRTALHDLASAVLKEGLADPGPHRAGRDVLARALPRSAVVRPGAPIEEGPHDLRRTVVVASSLDDSYLVIQGPPGSGKTYTGAQIVIDLLGRGKRVGVTAPSHRAICNLLTEIEEHAPAHPGWSGLKKGSGEDEFISARDTPLIGNSNSHADFCGPAAPSLLAGTAWLWSRQDMREAMDYLVIDEAGQVALADALAMATAARNLILLGDPLQLAHVSQAKHPSGVGVSVLEHLLGEATTVPPERGVFLDRTRRMHPDITSFVSEVVYEGRLLSETFTADQWIDSAGELTGTGVRAALLDHEGNTRSSPEEAGFVADRVGELIGARYIQPGGTACDLAPGDVMVVAPYNAQVRCLRDALNRSGLAGVRVGTVDKFQGQQAAVVFFSMATSSGEEIPRNVEFLYSRNRLNVAVSRAKCLAVLVASPKLLTIRCRTVEQMRLVNALCRLVETAPDDFTPGS